MTHTVEINEGVLKVLHASSSIDDPLILVRDFPQEFRDVSPYIQTCLKPQGLVDVIQYGLVYSSSRYSGLGLGRHERQGVITEREVELGAILLPHIRRAVTISNILDAQTIERAKMAEVLDALRCSVILADARGRWCTPTVPLRHCSLTVT